MGGNIGFSSCRRSKCDVPKNFGNPNPKEFEILSTACNKNFTILLVKYKGCTNFEGEKILVYKGHVLKQLMKAREIDPHFCENHLSPIARFAPTEEGWHLALNLRLK